MMNKWLALNVLRQPKYYQEYSHALNDEQIKNVLASTQNLPLKQGTVSNFISSETYRRVKTISIPLSAEYLWLHDWAKNFIFEVNNKNFGYELLRMEPLQYIEYHADQQGMVHHHLDWYCDYQPRKLSMTIQLSDPAEYDGGDLNISINLEKPFTASKNKGDAIVFPSFLMHNVNTVTRGVRRSLVVWCIGPEFR